MLLPTPSTPGQSVAPPRILFYRNATIRAGAALWPGVGAWVIIGLCCLAPIVWMIAQLVVNPTTLRELYFDGYRLRLLARTLLYNGAVALIATMMAVPAAIVLGRGRGIFASLLWLILPISLLLPSLAFAYGWSQYFELLDVKLVAASWQDIARCVWSLATWLWPVPAMVMGIALRRSDPQVQEQAMLDGALWRVTLRMLVAPAIASAAIVAILAMQEFAVYEPTGISVIATEVRMVFERGAFSSPANPITQQMMGAGAVAESSAQGAGSLGLLPDQRARAAAAVATSLPMLCVVALLCIVALVSVRKLSVAEHVEAGAWSRALDAPWWLIFTSWVLVAIALVVPAASMVLALKRPFDLPRTWNEFGPQATGTIVVGGAAGAIALLLAMLASVRRTPAGIWVALLSFLIGAQLVAIALIRIYNRPWLEWIYNGWPVMTMAYVARFGWIALAAAGATWGLSWRGLRDLAAVDGATHFQTARAVIFPLAWPILLAGASFVMILSLSEVPATVLLNPQRPQMLVPMLMTWVHLQRSDVMIEACLLLGLIVIALSLITLLLLRVGVRWAPRMPGLRPRGPGFEPSQTQVRRLMTVGLLIALLVGTGCSDRARPNDIWFETGNGRGQTVYPRAITYSASDDTFFICDRQARIQHFDRRGNVLHEWHTPLSLQGKPVGLSVGPDGNLWVPDTHYYRVLVYSPGGKLLKEFGTRGTGPGQFIYPTDVAFSPDGRVFVSEYGDNDRIQVFDMDGNFKYTFGRFGQGEGEFMRPQSLLIDGDLIYVTDSCNHRIAVFTLDGKFVRNVGSVGSGLGEFRFPYGLDRDAEGNLIVCEFGNNRVQKIDPRTGNGIAAWGEPGRAPGQLAYPWAVAVDKRDRIVTVDAGNNRLQVFQF